MHCCDHETGDTCSNFSHDDDGAKSYCCFCKVSLVIVMIHGGEHADDEDVRILLIKMITATVRLVMMMVSRS